MCVSTNVSRGKNFRGKRGRAFLFAHAVNVMRHGEPEKRTMTSGVFLVCDMACVQCEAVIGWKYLKALEDESQKYKEQKFILDVASLLRQDSWLFIESSPEL